MKKYKRVKILKKYVNAIYLNNNALTLIRPSESAYGSQFLISNLPQVHKFEFNETNMYSLSFLWRLLIYLLNCLKTLLSIVFSYFDTSKYCKWETFHLTRGRTRLPAFEKCYYAGICPTSVVQKSPPIHPLIREFSEIHASLLHCLLPCSSRIRGFYVPVKLEPSYEYVYKPHTCVFFSFYFILSESSLTVPLGSFIWPW